MQEQRWNKARPELIELFLKPLHALTERYEGKVILGEISGDDAFARRRVHQRRRPRHRLQLRPAELPGHAQGHPRHGQRLEKTIGDGWGCWSFSNHDVRRAVTRWGGDDRPRRLRRLVPVLLGSLRGTVCLYQGELGLEEAVLAFEQLKDPFGIAFWPAFPAATAAARPCPGESTAPEAGFTAGEPWLPLPESHRRRAVDVQAPRRRVGAGHHPRLPQLAPRAAGAADRAIQFLRANGDLLAFERDTEADRLLCLFNLGGEPR